MHQTTTTVLAFFMVASGLAACGSDSGSGLDGGNNGVGRVPDANTIDAPPPAIDGGGDAGTSDGGMADAGGIDAAPGTDANTGNPSDVVINELVIDNVDGSGSDPNEYLEVFGMPNTDYSNLTIVHIDGDFQGNGAGGNAIPTTGQILTTHPVGTTDANGFWDNAAVTATNTFQNGTQVFLLVEGLSASAGTDLDTNDDGVLDVTPWTTIVDAVAMDDQAGDANYIYGGATAVAKPSNVGGASRIPNGTDTNSAADWLPNPVDGVADNANEADNTPGAANTSGD